MGILAEPHIDCIMIFRYISVDVVEPSVADLDVYVATEYELQELHEGGYDFLRASGKVCQ